MMEMYISIVEKGPIHSTRSKRISVDLQIKMYYLKYNIEIWKEIWIIVEMTT